MPRPAGVAAGPAVNLAQAWHKLRAGHLAVQALGPLCGFVTVLLIARLGGAAVQGGFAQTKAWIELLVVIGCFGFPQSFVYVVNRLGASARALGWISLAYSLAFVPLGWAVTHLALSMGWTHVEGSATARFLMVLSAALYVLHGLWRGVYLTTRHERGFALFSILPPSTLLACVLAGMAVGGVGFPVMFVVSAALSVGLALVFVRPLLRRPRAPAPAAALPWKALFSNGTHSFAQAALLVLQPLLAYALVRGQGGGDHEIGLFNAGVFLVQGLSVPITMLSPLLFAHWTATDDASRIARLQALTGRWLALDAVLGIAAALASLVLVPVLFGEGHRAAVPLVAAMMLGLPLTCHGRLMAPALHAHDRPAVNSVAGVLRLASLALGGWGFQQVIGDPLLAVAVAWGVSEAIATAWVLLALRQIVRGSGKVPR
jgi:O-antigen/teichoic acid export membrane protein